MDYQTARNGRKSRNEMKRNRIMKVTLDVKPEQEVVLFDMRSRNTVTLKIYERNGGTAIEFRSPANVRICKEN